MVSMETVGRASATPSHKARLAGLFLQLLYCFYPGRWSHLHFTTTFLCGGGERQFSGVSAGIQGRRALAKASIWRSPSVSISKPQVASLSEVTGAWVLVPASLSGRATCWLPLAQQPVVQGSLGYHGQVGQGASSQVQDSMSMLSFTFIEQRPQFPCEARRVARKGSILESERKVLVHVYV